MRRIVRRQQEYTRNVPSAGTLAPRGNYEIPFDFGDGNWEPQAVIVRMSRPNTRLAAIYHVVESPEALFHNIWIGRLRSGPVQLS
jgi:hypothetical protein